MNDLNPTRVRPPAVPHLAMSGRRCLTLEAIPAAARQAREFVRQVLKDEGITGQNEHSELITSELLTNALLHAPPSRPGDDCGPGELLVRVVVLGGCLRIEVQDANPRLPQMKPEVTALDESGRGLQIVDVLTAGRWGSDPVPGGGKVTWAELSLPETHQETAT